MIRALIGDCGGTFCRFALVEGEKLTPLGRFRNRDFKSLGDIIEHLKVKADTLALAIAGPDNREEISFTNYPFKANREDLLLLGFDQCLLMNDFVPLSLALSNPDKLDLTTINGEIQAGNRLVIGPGTGLGVGALVKVRDKFLPIATETGHISFDPFKVNEKTCAESYLSGSGFVKIYTQLTGENNETPESLVAALPTNKKAQEAAVVFFNLLAQVASDLALIFLPHGGIFITGGMAGRLKPYFDQRQFMENFIDRKPYEDFLSKMPIHFIENQDPAFLGLQALVTNPEDFIL